MPLILSYRILIKLSISEDHVFNFHPKFLIIIYLVFECSHNLIFLIISEYELHIN